MKIANKNGFEDNFEGTYAEVRLRRRFEPKGQTTEAVLIGYLKTRANQRESERVGKK